MRDNGFFHMDSGDLLTIVGLLAAAALLFLPWTQNAAVSGMVLFGWLIGLYMVAAPIIGLVRSLRQRG